MTRQLFEVFQDLVADEPSMHLRVADVIARGQRRRAQRRWLLAAVTALLLPLPAVGLGVAGALTGGPPVGPRPALTVTDGAHHDPPPVSPQATSRLADSERPQGAPSSSTRSSPGSSPGSTPSAPANQLADPGFEVIPTRWAKFKAETTVLTSTTAAHSGAHALVVSTTATGPATGGVTSSPVQVTTVEGTSYTASCWVNAPSKIDVVLQVQEYTLQPDNTWLRATDAVKSPQVHLADPQHWYQLSVTYIAQHTGNLLPLSVLTGSLRAGVNSFVVDDCSLAIGS